MQTAGRSLAYIFTLLAHQLSRSGFVIGGPSLLGNYSFMLRDIAVRVVGQCLSLLSQSFCKIINFSLPTFTTISLGRKL